MKRFNSVITLFVALIVVLSFSSCSLLFISMLDDTSANNNSENALNVSSIDGEASEVSLQGELSSNINDSIIENDSNTSISEETNTDTPSIEDESVMDESRSLDQTSDPETSKDETAKPETSKPETSKPDNTSNPEVSNSEITKPVGNGKATPVDLAKIPKYSGKAYVVINKNIPSFSVKELTSKPYVTLSELDSIGRCGSVIALCSFELMPEDGETLGSISSIKPTGWVQAQYDHISGKYLYNRCHLIGWQLSANTANKKNIVTGTRYMNTEGMLPFENMVADYIKETKNHVAYRVTPIFVGNNLVCSGVQIEAYSVEDHGVGICFNVYCYNVQPNVEIDYGSGKSKSTYADTSYPETSLPENSKPETSIPENSTSDTSKNEQTYILNTNTKKIHLPDCSSAKRISSKNKREYTGDIEALYDEGYTNCSNCLG